MPTGSRLAISTAGGVVAAVVALSALVGGHSGVASAQDASDPEVRRLQLDWVDPDEVMLAPIIGGLDPATVLVVTAAGYRPDTTGSVRQCATGPTRRCSNQVPVRTDGAGGAAFQYLVTDVVDRDGHCRLSSATRCTVELVVGERSTEIDTVFVDDAPDPGRLRLTPSSALTAGDTVVVELSDLPPATRVLVEVCAAPATSGGRCGPPGPQVEVVTDADGFAGTTMILDIDEVGRDRVACGRRTPCQVVATSSTVGARVAPVRLDLAAAPAVTYDGERLTLGLLGAALLVGAAGWIVRRTDWQPPAEADASAVDEAAWADLDAEAAAFDQEPVP